MYLYSILKPLRAIWDQQREKKDSSKTNSRINESIYSSINY